MIRAEQTQPSARATRLASVFAGRAPGVGAVLLALRVASAAAFPLVDPSNQDAVPNGTELPAPDVQDLQHQLQLANGLSAPSSGGWTIIPRIDVQEMLTDNVLQQHAPRQWDMVTYIAPGIGLAANTSRLQMNFSYAPTLAIYANEGILDSLTQQLTGSGLLTVMPELAFVDVRAVSGVHSIYGGIGGLGTVGASNGATTSTTVTIPSLAGNSLGLNRDDEVQTSSFVVSPYLLHQFGDWGTGKLGYSYSVSQSSELTGFATSPFPSSSANTQILTSNEEIAHFATGDFLGRLQDSIDIDLIQSTTTTGSGYGTTLNGTTVALPVGNTTSSREFIADRISYALNRDLTVFASLGHEDIVYRYPSGQSFNNTAINDATWSFGATLTPSPDSFLTASFGHLNGYDSLTVSAHYALTKRTTLTASYGSTLGTQLENLQSQLNQSTVTSSGTLVNAQNGGPLYSNVNALAVEDGVFRTDTIALGTQTVWDRDILALNLFLTKQTQQNVNTAAITTATTFNLQWIHQIHDDLTLSAAVAYSLQDQGNSGTATLNNRSLATSAALQYQISETLTGSLRYSFFDQDSTLTADRLYQNLLIVGISKTF